MSQTSRPALAEGHDPGVDEERERRRRRDRGRRVKSALAVLLSLAVVSAVVLGSYGLLGRVLDRVVPDPAADYPGPGSGQATVEVRRGDTVGDIAETLVASDVVASEEAFVDAAAEEPRAERIQPGEYDLPRRIPAADALAVLVDPTQRQVLRVVLPEGRRLSTNLDAIAKATGLSRERLGALARSPGQLGLPGWADGRLEGFVAPATYEFDRDVNARDVLRTTVRRAEQVFDDLRFEERAEDLGYTPLEVLTVASLVEAEAPAGARAKVAQVLYNRLEMGMALQLDSTVNYVTGKSGITTTEADREVDSPYNTYANPGLPPGPINSPGTAAISAALQPAEGDWLYFVTVDPSTGETKFTDDYDEHLDNVEEFRDWLREQE